MFRSVCLSLAVVVLSSSPLHAQAKSDEEVVKQALRPKLATAEEKRLAKVDADALEAAKKNPAAGWSILRKEVDAFHARAKTKEEALRVFKALPKTEALLLARIYQRWVVKFALADDVQRFNDFIAMAGTLASFGGINTKQLYDRWRRPIAIETIRVFRLKVPK